MNRKGQGALEYLILIVGAVVVAAIVIALLGEWPDDILEVKRSYDIETETWKDVQVCAEYMKTGNIAELNIPCEELGPGWEKEQLSDGYLCKKCVLTETKRCLAQTTGSGFNQRYNYLCSDVIK